MPVDINAGITHEQAAQVVDGLDPKTADKEQCIEQVKRLYKLFREGDCTLLEVSSSLGTAG